MTPKAVSGNWIVRDGAGKLLAVLPKTLYRSEAAADKRARELFRHTKDLTLTEAE